MNVDNNGNGIQECPISFPSALVHESLEKYVVLAGLLTYPILGGLPIDNDSGVVSKDLCVGITAAGLSGNFTRFPFHRRQLRAF